MENTHTLCLLVVFVLDIVAKKEKKKDVTKYKNVTEGDYLLMQT